MKAEQYLKDHGITEAFALNHGLAWDENYLNIPIKDHEGNILFLKSRNLNYGAKDNNDPKYKNPIGSKATLFNLHAVKEAKNIVICEGEIDCLKLTEEGVPAISSTGGATTFNEDWVELLEDKGIYICYDNDEAGNKAVHKLLEYFPDARIMQLPEGIKDASDYFVAGNTRDDFVKMNTLTLADWSALNRPEEFNTISGNDLFNMEVPEYSWLIKGLIYSEGFAFIYGAEGTGKSYITLSMAKATITGTPWLDKFETTKGNVLFLDKENPTPMIKKRAEGLGITPDAIGDDINNIHWLKYPHKFQLTNNEGEISDFAKELSNIITQKKIDLIIIDSLVDLVVGNENSSGDTQAFFNAIKELYPDIAYLPIHHENKPSQGVTRSSSQRLRGSTNISAQAQTMFRVEQLANSKTEMTLQQTKARDAVKMDKFMLRMNVKKLPGGETTISHFEYVGDVDDAIDETKASEIQEAIMTKIRTNGFIRRKDALELGGNMASSQATILRALNGLISNGEVSKNKKGREVIYSKNMFTIDDTIKELNAPIS